MCKKYLLLPLILILIFGFVACVGSAPLEEYTVAEEEDGTPNSRIAFVSDRSGNPEIYMIYDDGSNLQCLTNNPATDSQPFWSP